MNIFTPAFWGYAFERAVKTAAQSSLGVLTAELVLDRGSWAEAVIVVGVATAASVLTSIQNAPSAFEIESD